MSQELKALTPTMNATRIRILSVAALCAATFSLTNCATPESKGWQRPARPGERVGQVMEVDGTRVRVGIDVTYLVQAGDVLSVHRFYCEPGTGRKDTKDCRSFESGAIRVEAMDAEEHTATGRVLEGNAAADSPVFMRDPSLSGRLTTNP